MEKINRAKADYIFFLGDLIDDYSSYTGDVGRIEELLPRFTPESESMRFTVITITADRWNLTIRM